MGAVPNTFFVLKDAVSMKDAVFTPREGLPLSLQALQVIQTC